MPKVTFLDAWIKQIEQINFFFKKKKYLSVLLNKLLNYIHHQTHLKNT